MNLKKQCQEIWQRAATGQDVILQFSGKGDMERARFALYDAVRNSGNEQLITAREACEIKRDTEKLSLTIARKDKNPFYCVFSEALTGTTKIKEGEEGMEDSIARSLREFEEKLAREKAEEIARPKNPYFDRGGE